MLSFEKNFKFYNWNLLYRLTWGGMLIFLRKRRFYIKKKVAKCDVDFQTKQAYSFLKSPRETVPIGWLNCPYLFTLRIACRGGRGQGAAGFYLTLTDAERTRVGKDECYPTIHVCKFWLIVTRKNETIISVGRRMHMWPMQFGSTPSHSFSEGEIFLMSIVVDIWNIYFIAFTQTRIWIV